MKLVNKILKESDIFIPRRLDREVGEGVKKVKLKEHTFIVFNMDDLGDEHPELRKYILSRKPEMFNTYGGAVGFWYNKIFSLSEAKDKFTDGELKKSVGWVGYKGDTGTMYQDEDEIWTLDINGRHFICLPKYVE